MHAETYPPIPSSLRDDFLTGFVSFSAELNVCPDPVLVGQHQMLEQLAQPHLLKTGVWQDPIAEDLKKISTRLRVKV
jgi:hypothetical protein